MKGDRWAGGALALLGLAVGLEASTFEVAFLTDPVGPKALPYLAAGLLVATGAWLALRPGSDPDWPPRRPALRMAGAVAALLGYAALLAPMGFVTATSAAVAALSVLFGAPVRKAVAAAVVVSLVLWVGFVQVLGLPLPLGSLWIR
ncbi:MAG TPA: tripartite tricarboxylate transporter TctB family protein [Longimicrobiales bacterium]|nr:tripartite tricarboxylate transporter TctB family protein [Longimicrobiales bacterium]